MENETSASVINMKKITELQIMLDYDNESLLEIISEYLKHNQINVDALEVAVRTLNFADIRAIAHKMRSPSNYLGAEKLGEVFDIIESCAIEENAECICNLMVTVDEEMNKVVEELKKICDNLSVNHEGN